MSKKVDTGKMPEKIMAVARYHSDLLVELNNTKNRNQIIESGLKILGKHFGAYLDNLARREHLSFHHVYETGRTGDESARLFSYTINNANGVPTLQFNLKEASMPEKSGQVFKRKAFIMEDGTPLTINPKRGKLLVFQLNGQDIFAKQSYVPNPGGTAVQGSFANAFNSYIENTADSVLTDMGFYDKINSMMEKESEDALSKISNGRVDDTSMSKTSAKRIVRSLK